jgi:signal transduction histidine kinase
VFWRNVLIALSAVVLIAGVVHPVAMKAPALRSAVETVILVCATAAAWKFYAQFVSTRRSSDLLLFGALLLLALTWSLAYTAPAVLDGHHDKGLVGVGAWGKLFVAAAFAALAFAPRARLVAGGRRPVAAVVAASTAAVGLAGILNWLLPQAEIQTTEHPMIGVATSLRHPLACCVVLGTASLWLVAAVGFARQPRRRRDDISGLISGACIIWAACWLYYFPLPGLAYDWMSPCEGLRLLGFVLVLAAAGRRGLRAQAEIARASGMAERRRVAQDLHDGLGQDLALIAAHSKRMAIELGTDHPVTIAARRALAVSRETIGELSGPENATTAEALEAIASELGSRFGMSVAVLCDLDSDPEPGMREQLTRIAREAIANAGRHGGASQVLVSLSETSDGLVLRVHDDGCGISPGGEEGFGIGSMRERAATLGASLTVAPEPHRGTVVEVLMR